MSYWKHAGERPVRQMDIDESAAVEHVLDVAEAWAAGEMPLGHALQEGGGIEPHRARGLAFRHCRGDARLSALERLSYRMSAAFSTVLSDGTMQPTGAWQASERQVSWYRSQRERNAV